MNKVTWHLKEFLEENELKPRDVENKAIKLGFKFGRNSIYRLLKGDGPRNANLQTLTVLVTTLRVLTKSKVNVSDLLKYK